MKFEIRFTWFIWRVQSLNQPDSLVFCLLESKCCWLEEHAQGQMGVCRLVMLFPHRNPQAWPANIYCKASRGEGHVRRHFCLYRTTKCGRMPTLLQTAQGKIQPVTLTPDDFVTMVTRFRQRNNLDGVVFLQIEDFNQQMFFFTGSLVMLFCCTLIMLTFKH